MTYKRILSVIVALIVAMVFTVGMVAAASLSSTPVRGVYGDMWADVVLGKPDFGEMGPNEVTSGRVFNPGGVIIDRSVTPNRMYVYDGGNSRVLGLHVGSTQSGQQAELVLGQPGLSGYAGCNHDGNFQTYPLPATPSASSLCTMPFEQVSPREGGSFANMAVDSAGNLYVPDFMNHRVLLYISPFETDTIADDVWGQNDFTGMLCNRGKGYYSPDAQSLCLRNDSGEGFVGGVGMDSANNLWITDNQNNRVLRFPYDAQTGRPSHTANLVLGQVNFITVGHGSGMNKMYAPAGVRVNAAGSVYVADSLNNRILIFNPPFTNGMAASSTLGSNLLSPTSIEFDQQGNTWVSDSANNQLLRFTPAGVVDRVLFKGQPTYTSDCGDINTPDGPPFSLPAGGSISSVTLCDSRGSIGIDSDGNIWVSGSNFVQDVRRYPAPFPALGVAHSADVQLFKPYSLGEANAITAKGLSDPRGITLGAGQLIVSDIGRIVFWNNAPDSLTSGKPADGYIAVDNFNTIAPYTFGKVKADKQNHLWTIQGDRVKAYQLPLVSGQNPFYTLPLTIPVKGGGNLTMTSGLDIGGMAVTDAGDYLWLADPVNNRVFRIATPLTTPTVDVVLGQVNATDNQCSQGQGMTHPARTTLCMPGSVSLDPNGNVFVSGFALEDNGDYRLLEYDASLFPSSPASAIFNTPASRVYGTSGSFTAPGCINQNLDPLCRPLETAFNQSGRMVVGLSGYVRNFFPLVYQDPLNNPLPVDTLKDFYSMPSAVTYDEDGNLYVADQNRGRVLMYWQSQLIGTRTPSRTPTETLTPTITLTPSITPTPSITSTATITPHPWTSVDEFDSPTLDPIWTWHAPFTGPTYSLSANPGHFQMTVPPGFDHTQNIDRSPQLRRSDMGAGSFTIETSVDLAATNAAMSSYEIALAVGFSGNDQLLLSVRGDGTLHIIHPDIEDVSLGAVSLPVSLRIEKTYAGYVFKTRYPNQQTWTTRGTYNLDDQVLYVGLMVRTFNNTPGNAVFDTDYFSLESYSTPIGTNTPTPISSQTKTQTPTIGGLKVYSIKSQDGWVLESAENSNTGGTLNSNNGVFSLGDDSKNRQYRTILSFNTDGIPDNATITKVQLRILQQSIIGGGNPVAIFKSFMVDIKKGFIGTTANLQTIDFSATTDHTYGPFNLALTGSSYTFNLINGKNDINKLGLTQIRLRFKLDDNNNQVANMLNLYSSNDQTLGKHPTLLIAYTTP